MAFLHLGDVPMAFPGIETELAQLRQEIATERLERQHLARLVESLVKDDVDHREMTGKMSIHVDSKGPIV